MEKILSQEEIDALLLGLAEGKIDTTPEKKEEVGVKPFNFRDYAISTKLKIPGFEVLSDYLARSLRMSFSTMLREMIELIPMPAQMERFKDFLNRIPVPTSIHIFKPEPLKGHGLLVIDAPLVFVFVERFLGGGEKKTIKVEGREFTPIEQRLIKRVVDVIFTEMERAWRNIYPIKIKYLRSEVNPQFARVMLPEETIVVTGFSVELESLNGKILFCYSMTTLQPIMDKLYSPYQLEEVVDPKWRLAIEKSILNSPVEVKALLGTGTITLKDLINLEVGDVILLDKKVEEPIEVLVENTPKYLGKMGNYKDHLAIQITNLILSEKEES